MVTSLDGSYQFTDCSCWGRLTELESVVICRVLKQWCHFVIIKWLVQWSEPHHDQWDQWLSHETIIFQCHNPSAVWQNCMGLESCFNTDDNSLHIPASPDSDTELYCYFLLPNSKNHCINWVHFTMSVQSKIEQLQDDNDYAIVKTDTPTNNARVIALFHSVHQYFS